MAYISTLSNIYAPNYVLSDLFEFSIVTIDSSFSPEKILETSIDSTTIDIILSYEITDLKEPNTDYRVNGANYYYDNMGYSAFANLEAIAIYIRKYCFIGNILSTKIFNSLIPKYIVVFQTVLVNKRESLELYIGKRKDL
jgi:hypothetical protein